MAFGVIFLIELMKKRPMVFLDEIESRLSCRRNLIITYDEVKIYLTSYFYLFVVSLREN